MAWYDLDTKELVDECNVCEYIEKTWTMDEHREYLKSCDIDPRRLSKTDLRCSYLDLIDSYQSVMNRNHDFASNFGLGWGECRCNKCMSYFESDDELEVIDDNGEFVKVCPNCMTEEYLMDLE